jgi:hypothetical protein
MNLTKPTALPDKPYPWHKRLLRHFEIGCSCILDYLSNTTGIAALPRTHNENGAGKEGLERQLGWKGSWVGKAVAVKVAKSLLGGPPGGHYVALRARDASVSGVFCKSFFQGHRTLCRKNICQRCFGAVSCLKIKYTFWTGHHLGYSNVEPCLLSIIRFSNT